MDLVIEESKKAPSCSGIAVAAPRTADGKLYFARNWDMTQIAMRPYLKYLALVTFNPDDGSLAFANIRPISQVYVETGINEKGILIEVNNGAGSDPTQNPDGTFVVVEFFNLLNECSAFDEVISRLTADELDGFFACEKAFYERTAWYNASSGRFDLAYSDLFAQTFELSDRALWVVPREPHFEGEIAVLVNPATISSGEGLAMAIGRLPNAEVLGFYVTHGSFGLLPWLVATPEGFAFEYPIGWSLDASGRIQIDADASGSGGIQPSIRVPRTAETMAAFASGTDMELEYARRWLLSH